MKSTYLAGIVLMILGALALAYQGITYRTRGKPVDLGPLQITTEQTHTIPLPPILGTLAMVGGIVLVVRGQR